MASRAMHCLTYLLLIVPPLLLTVYLLVAFPTPPEALIVHSSLSGLPKHCKSWDIYPEDFYPGGDYVDFPHGRVRYWTMGPKTGQKIVLIHGLSVPALIWKDIAPTLAARGHHVLLYDLYGRGYSDAPRTTYDTRLYTIQLALLMQHVGWNKAAVVGVSMGGAIASTFTATFPQLVENKIAFISSTGIIETSDLPRTLKVMSSPIVQKVTSSTPIRKFVQHLTEASPGPSIDPLQEIVRIQAAYLPGFNAAIGSSLRDGPIRGLAPSFRSEAFNGRDVLIIHGTQDTTVPFKYASQIAALLPAGARSELITVPNGGHDLTISHPDLVLDALEKFLSS